MRFVSIFVMLFLMVLVFGCGNSSPTESKDNGSGVETAQTEEKAKGKTSKRNTEETKDTQKIFAIKGEGIVLRVGPGTEFDRVYNEKASKALNRTEYASIDYSVKVIVEDSKGGWSRVRVIEPEHLAQSHKGWIPSSSIVPETEESDVSFRPLENETFEIIKTKHNFSVQNFFVLIKTKDLNEDNVHAFVQRFRKQFCTKDCNIGIYDSKSILPLIDKYPLKGKEYVDVADHFIAFSTFDAPNVKSWYPYQDFTYKGQGGKNWKKKPK